MNGREEPMIDFSSIEQYKSLENDLQLMTGRLQSALDELELEKYAKAKVQKQLEDMYQSRSWRITAPIRAVIIYSKVFVVAILKPSVVGLVKLARKNPRLKKIASIALDLFPSIKYHIMLAGLDLEKLRQDELKFSGEFKYVDRLIKYIYVDVTGVVDQDLRTGIQRVIRGLLSSMLQHPPTGYAIKPVYAKDSGLGYISADKYESLILNGAFYDADELEITPKSGDVFLGLDFQVRSSIQQQYYLDFMQRNGVAVYFVAYDLLPILLPKYFPPIATAGHKEWLKTVARYNGVFCISKSVANELKNWYEASGIETPPSFQIDWFHLGADMDRTAPTAGRPENHAEIKNHLQNKPSFLMVGTIEPRKGHAEVLTAFEKLWADQLDINLVIVGKQGWMVETLAEKLRKHPQVGIHLFWLEGISDEYLTDVYKFSACLIVASEGEGFGLPLIEGAQYKLPIIARDIPVFREVAGEHAYYFGIDGETDMASAIASWLNLHKEGQHPTTVNMHWSTWNQSAAQLTTRLLNAIEQIDRLALEGVT